MSETSQEERSVRDIHSITDLLRRAGSQRFLEPVSEDLGLAEPHHYPFLALVGQRQMKLALILSVINPAIGGVLLIGPRGTGKTTAVRGLAPLLPEVERSRCPYGCLPEDILAGGMDAVCPDCAKRYGENDPLTYPDPVHIVELPLNSRLPDVIGELKESGGSHIRMRIRRGILSRADQNLLFVDEINLLDQDVANSMLDAASQGSYTVHRGRQVATYRSRFSLIGSMNPEEGPLRPQILDRFGLRIIVEGLKTREERDQAYQRALSYRANPLAFQQQYHAFTEQIRLEIQSIQLRLPEVKFLRKTKQVGLELIQSLGIHSLRAEMTLFEAARAYTLAEGRKRVQIRDLIHVAPMALRMRRSDYMETFLSSQREETDDILHAIEQIAL